jgi:hypothetical protein
MRMQLRVQRRHGCDQFACVGVGRCVQHLVTLADFHQAAAFHDRNAVGDLRHHAKVMGDKQNAVLPPPAQVAHQLQHLGLGGHVKGGGGLVGDQ